ncbi:MAG: hypothetical protein NVSMB22_04150 [Chloroflexota bacterium]
MCDSIAMMAHTDFDGRYDVLTRLGAGGMAEVYRAFDRRLQREVAIKILNAESAADPVFVERFRREAQSVARLNDAHIVSIYDWGESPTSGLRDRRTYYMVMELVPGQNLKERLAGQPIEEVEALDIAAEVAAALAVAHRHGIIHRDIKPQNILINAAGAVKVVDFGIAYTAGVTQLTKTNAVAGTAHYLSPEQAQSKPVDSRSDLYSLGVVLFEMLTGREPFQGTTLVEVAMRHVHDAPPDPSSFVPGLSARTRDIISRALAKDPAQRFSDASAMRVALLDARRALSDGPSRSGVDGTVAAPLAAAAETMPPTAGRPVMKERHRSVSRESPIEGRWPARLLMAVPVLLLVLVALPFLLLSHAPLSTHTALHGTTGTTSIRNHKGVGATPTPLHYVPPRINAPGGGSPSARSQTVRTPVTQPTLAPTPVATRPASVAVMQRPPSPTAMHGAAGSPVQTISDFYGLISSGQLSAAASLETSSMKSAWPPQDALYARFAQTEQVTIQPPRIVSQTDRTAVLRVNGHDEEKPGSARSSQDFYLTWTLVKTDAGWKLDSVST